MQSQKLELPTTLFSPQLRMNGSWLSTPLKRENNVVELPKNILEATLERNASKSRAAPVLKSVWMLVLPLVTSLSARTAVTRVRKRRLSWRRRVRRRSPWMTSNLLPSAARSKFSMTCQLVRWTGRREQGLVFINQSPVARWCHICGGKSSCYLLFPSHYWEIMLDSSH